MNKNKIRGKRVRTFALMVALVISTISAISPITHVAAIALETYTITFEANGGTGTMDSVDFMGNETYEIPYCQFTPPAGKRFKAWAVGSADGTTAEVGDVLTRSTTLYALWEDIPANIVASVRLGDKGEIMYYSTWARAVNYANTADLGTTAYVTMLRDITSSNFTNVISDWNIRTADGNNPCTLSIATGASNSKWLFYIGTSSDAGTLTIESGIYENNTLFSNTSLCAKTINVVNGSVTVNGGTIHCSTGNALSVTDGQKAYLNHANTTLKSASEIYATIVDRGYLTIDGANIEATQGHALSVYETGETTINGADTILKNTSSANDAVYNTGHLTINNGTFTSKQKGAMFISGAGQTTIHNGTFNSDNSAYATIEVWDALEGDESTALVIQGGTITNSHSEGIAIGNYTNRLVKINGGSYTGGIRSICPIDGNGYLGHSLSIEYDSKNNGSYLPADLSLGQLVVKNANNTQYFGLCTSCHSPWHLVADSDKANLVATNRYPIVFNSMNNDQSTTYYATANGQAVSDSYLGEGKSNLVLERKGYLFGGWYNKDYTQQIIDASGNIQPLTSYTDTSGNWKRLDQIPVLYARWISLEPQIYTIIIKNDGNGTATADKENASSGTLVTLSATPKEGYQFKEWQVVSGQVVITNQTFTMPTENVIVKAIFEKKQAVAATKKIKQNADSKKTKTGDQTSFLSWVNLMILSFAGIVILKKNKADE